MTVSELMTKLSRYPGAMDVVLPDAAFAVVSDVYDVDTMTNDAHGPVFALALGSK